MVLCGVWFCVCNHAVYLDAEVPKAAKLRNLEARIVMADTGALKKGVVRLVALEREL